VLHRRPGVVKNEQGSSHLTRRMRRVRKLAEPSRLCVGTWNVGSLMGKLREILDTIIRFARLLTCDIGAHPWFFSRQCSLCSKRKTIHGDTDVLVVPWSSTAGLLCSSIQQFSWFSTPDPCSENYTTERQIYIYIYMLATGRTPVPTPHRLLDFYHAFTFS
jgi:hypothetical protein